MSELQAQCWICPECYDDSHHQPGDETCLGNLKKIRNELARDLESERYHRMAVERSHERIQDVANHVCANAPEGCVIQLCLENGAAWVELYDLQGCRQPLPDSADKSLIEQLNDALCVANGWEVE